MIAARASSRLGHRRPAGCHRLQQLRGILGEVVGHGTGQRRLPGPPGQPDAERERRQQREDEQGVQDQRDRDVQPRPAAAPGPQPGLHGPRDAQRGRQLPGRGLAREQVQVQVQQLKHGNGGHGGTEQEPEQEPQRPRDVPVISVIKGAAVPWRGRAPPRGGAVPVVRQAEQRAEDHLNHQADDRPVCPQRPVPAEPGDAAPQPDRGQQHKCSERKQAGKLLPGSHTRHPTRSGMPG